jgi:hypothetical protein
MTVTPNNDVVSYNADGLTHTAQGVVILNPEDIGGGSSGATEATQLLVKAGIGAPNDAAATTDAGTFSIIALIKRGLQNWTTLIGRIPASLGAKTSAASLAVVIASDQAAVAARDTNGSGAVRYTTDTTPVTGGSFAQIHCLTATTFSALTRTNGTGSLTGVSLPAGTLLIGPFTAYTLTSGAVAAYS